MIKLCYVTLQFNMRNNLKNKKLKLSESSYESNTNYANPLENLPAEILHKITGYMGYHDAKLFMLSSSKTFKFYKDNKWVENSLMFDFMQLPNVRYEEYESFRKILRESLRSKEKNPPKDPNDLSGWFKKIQTCNYKNSSTEDAAKLRYVVSAKINKFRSLKHGTRKVKYDDKSIEILYKAGFPLLSMEISDNPDFKSVKMLVENGHVDSNLSPEQVTKIKTIISEGQKSQEFKDLINNPQNFGLKSKKVSEVLYSNGAENCYATGIVSKDILDKTDDKIFALLTTSAYWAYKAGIKIDYIKDFPISQIKILLLKGAADCYKAGVKITDLLSVDESKIKSLIRVGAYKCYNAGININEIKDLDIEKIAVIMNHNAALTYQTLFEQGITIKDIACLPAQKIAALINGKSNHIYKNFLPFNEVKEMNANKIKALVMFAYKHKDNTEIAYSDIKDMSAGKLNALSSDLAMTCFKYGLKIKEIMHLSCKVINTLTSVSAAEIFKLGIDPDDIMNFPEKKQALYLSKNALEFYKAGGKISDLYGDDSKEKVFISSNASKYYTAGLSFNIAKNAMGIEHIFGSNLINNNQDNINEILAGMCDDSGEDYM